MRFSLKDRPIAQGVVSSFIYTGIVLGGGALLAILKVWYPAWFAVVCWGFVGSALTATIVAVFVLIKRIPKLPPQVTPENVESNIRAWFESFRVAVKTIDEPQTLFALLVTLDNDMRILVTRPKALDRYIVLQSSIIISPADKAMFDGLPEEEKGLFAGRLAVELSKTGMGYVMDLATSSNITLLRRVPITANLNEGNFMEAVDALDNAKQGALRTLILMLVDLRKHLAAEEGAAQAQAAALLPPR